MGAVASGGLGFGEIMSFSRASFIDGYVSEVTEHIGLIKSIIFSLKDNPDAFSKESDAYDRILRSLHTIKGSSRMLDFGNMESLSHNIESVIRGLEEKKYILTMNIVNLIAKVLEQMEYGLLRIEDYEEDDMDINMLVENCRKASAGYFFNLEGAENEDGGKKALSKESESKNLYGGEKSFEDIKSVRIEINKINGIIQSFDDLIIRQFRLKNQMKIFENSLDEKKGDVRELPRQLKEELTNIENALFESQHRIFELRMLPLEIIMHPVRKEIELEASSLGKKVSVDIQQTTYILDKIILEKLRIILLHLAKNSLYHGIEDEKTRLELGKSPEGHISIKTSQMAGRIVISVSDDGSGIKFEKVRESAIELFQNRKMEIEKMTEKDLQQYIFVPGVSARNSSSDGSGHGLGLEVVRDLMEKIKGNIKVVSRKNEGTVFELSIPLTLATQRGLFVHAGGTKIMIPSHYIHEVVTFEDKNLINMHNQPFLNVHDKLVPLYFLSAILDAERPEKIVSVIIVEYLEICMAIVVDTIQQNENVIMNPLPSILKGIDSIQGVVYDENYRIVPVLDIPSLMQRMRELVVYDIKKYQTRNIKLVKTVLVVDDSPTTRQVEESILEAAGYRVFLTADGIDALDVIKSQNVDLVVTDVEMPRMDGKTLLENIRRMKEAEKMPVVVISGSNDENERISFLSSGAQGFLTKHDFQRDVFLKTVKEVLNER